MASDGSMRARMVMRQELRCGPESFTDEVVPLDRIRCALEAMDDGRPMFHLITAGKAAGMDRGTKGAHLLVITTRAGGDAEMPALGEALAPFHADLDATRIGVCGVSFPDDAMEETIRGIAGIAGGERIIGAQWIGHRVMDGIGGETVALNPVAGCCPRLRVYGELGHPLLTDAVYFKSKDAGAFNATMERVDGALVVAYRYYGKEPGLRNRIALSRVDERGHAIDRKPLEMDAKLAAEIENFRGIDDPRLFYHGGKLFCAISSSAFPPYRTRMFYGEIVERDDRWEFVRLHEPKRWFRKWRKQEKNWQFFESGGELYVCYDHDRGRFFRIKGRRITKVIDGAVAKWDHGIIRGGTPPIAYGKNSLITFFHSYVGEKDERTYHMGALVFDRMPPFTPRMISREAMLSVDDRILNRGPFRARKVVFPSGAVATGDGFLISLGVNDCDSGFIRVTDEDMRLKELRGV